MRDRVVLSERTWQTAGLALLSALFTAGALWALLGGLDGRPVRLIGGALGTLFFGGATILLLRRWLGGGSAVSAGPDGLRDRRVAAEPIPWSAIHGMEFLDADDPAVLEVTLTVRREYVDRLRRGPAQRLQWKRDPDSGLPSVNISGATLRGDLPGFAALLKRHYPGWTSVTLQELSDRVQGPSEGKRR